MLKLRTRFSVVRVSDLATKYCSDDVLYSMKPTHLKFRLEKLFVRLVCFFNQF